MDRGHRPSQVIATWLVFADEAQIIRLCRGGGEYGALWHAAGSKAHKTNTFADYIACAELLIKKGLKKMNHNLLLLNIF